MSGSPDHSRTEPEPRASWWPDILASRDIPRIGQLLVSHPRATQYAAGLTRNLTVQKLVRIANKSCNYTSRDIERKLASPNREREAERAWEELRLKVQEADTAGGGKWAATVHLLEDEHAEAALEQIRAMDTARLMVVCQRIVSGPYRQGPKRAG